MDRTAYQHNFSAARSFRSGPYTIRAGWRSHHWAMGKSCRAPYQAAPVVLAAFTGCSRWKYHPAGYEWVRDGGDALLHEYRYRGDPAGRIRRVCLIAIQADDGVDHCIVMWW